jgi:hypothetical protein
MPTDEQMQVIVGAVVHLEKRFPGVNPSVKEIAEQAGLSNGTAWNHLKAAVGKGLLIQREGKFMSLAFARAVDGQLKEDTKKK